MKIDRSFYFLFDMICMSLDMICISKLNYYSWLIKWVYKERYELLLLKRKQQLNDNLQTKLKRMSF